MIMAIVFAVSCNVSGDTSSYKLITDEGDFVTVGGENIVELGATFDVTKLKVETQLYAGNQYSGSVITNVTPDMVTGDYSTDTVGRKDITVTISGETLKFTFYVKYGVKFMVGDELVSQQYLSEGEKPKIPDIAYMTPAGMRFVGWSPAVPDVISDNITFVAEYAESIAPPSLKTVNATYGQKLSELTLPKNDQGEWKFVDSGDTAVGNVGNNEFDVEFVTDEVGVAPIKGTVTVKVAKAKIEFTDIVTTFIYDGTKKYPTYTAPDGVNVLQMGDKEANVGTYDFTLLVSSDNYEGLYIGQYTITKAEATVTLPDYSYTFDEIRYFYPSEYTVSGVPEELLGAITLSKPDIGGEGEYRISVAYENTANVNCTASFG